MKTDHTDQSQSRFFNLGDKDSASDFATWGALNWQNGRIIDGKFKIVSLLGVGGMGTVFEAFHLALKKTVALKTFRANDITSDALQRFQREAQAIGRLNHINVVQVYDFGFTEENFPYYTMECLAGQSLAEYLAENGALSVPQKQDEQGPMQNPKVSSRVVLPGIAVLILFSWIFWVITDHLQAILRVPAKENTAANKDDWDGKPFRQPDDPDHPGCAVFYFPFKKSLGTLEWKDIEGGEPDMMKEAIGNVIGPGRTARLHFEAGETIQERPEYLRGFGSNDIDYLKLRTNLSWTDKHLKHIGHMSNLLALTIQGGYKITDACIGTINKLSNLQDLSVPASGITDGGLCRLDRLHQFTLLDLSNKGMTTKTILKLSQNSRLRNLYLDCCEISDDDVNNVCKISSLETISVNFCPFLTDKSLVRLFTLPNLIRLDICGTKVAPRELSRLLRGRHKLKELKFGFENFSKADGKEIVDLCHSQHINVKFQTGGQ
jgi:Protein kinase domain